MSKKTMKIMMNDDGTVGSYEAAYGVMVKTLTGMKVGDTCVNKHFNMDAIDYPVIVRDATKVSPASLTYEQAQVYLNTWAANLSRDADRNTSVLPLNKHGVRITTQPAALRNKGSLALMNITYQVGGSNQRKVNLLAHGLTGASFGAGLAFRAATGTVRKPKKSHGERESTIKVWFNWGIGRNADSEGTRKDAIAWAGKQSFPVDETLPKDCIGFACYNYGRVNGLIHEGRAPEYIAPTSQPTLGEVLSPVDATMKGHIETAVSLFDGDMVKVAAYVKAMTAAGL